MKRLVTGATRNIRQGCEESCSERSSQACCPSDSISVTSHKLCLRWSKHKDTTMILESLGANPEMSATGEDPVSRPYQRSKMGPWWVTFRGDRAPGRQAFYLLLGSAGLNLQPILFSFLSSVSVSLRLVLPHWLEIYSHVLSLIRCWHDQVCPLWILWERGSSCETVSVNLEITRMSEADLTFSPPSHPKVCLPRFNPSIPLSCAVTVIPFGWSKNTCWFSEFQSKAEDTGLAPKEFSLLHTKY